MVKSRIVSLLSPVHEAWFFLTNNGIYKIGSVHQHAFKNMWKAEKSLAIFEHSTVLAYPKSSQSKLKMSDTFRS